jgi:hypothetical protein
MMMQDLTAGRSAEKGQRNQGPFYFAWGCFRYFVSRPLRFHRQTVFGPADFVGVLPESHPNPANPGFERRHTCGNREQLK